MLVDRRRRQLFGDNGIMPNRKESLCIILMAIKNKNYFVRTAPACTITWMTTLAAIVKRMHVVDFSEKITIQY